MSKNFEQFHFSLLEKEQLDLLEPKRTREDWLRHRFSTRFSFIHHGREFWWVPQALSRDFLVGVVEREKFQIERTPPSEGGQEIEGKFWTGGMVVIDPRNRLGGQAVAFEHSANVGQPSAILSSMVAHINALPENQYSLLFKALFEGDSFWRFAEKHGGHLEYVRFRFSVQNMIFGAGGGVKKGLRRIGKDTDAEEVEVKIESSSGIRADSEAVREGMSYGEEGNATVTAKALNGERWTSAKTRLSIKVHHVIDLAKSELKDVQQWLRSTLDHGSDNIISYNSRPDRNDIVD